MLRRQNLSGSCIIATDETEKGKQKMIEAALYDLLNETVDVERRLSRIEVKDYFERTITFDNRFTRNGQTYSFGDGTIDFLIAGSVTKETAAGTGMVCLVNLLQRGTCNFRHMPVTWHFAPELDPADNAGMTAFRQTIRQIKPHLVCILPEPAVAKPKETASLMLKKPLPQYHFNLIGTMFAKSGFELQKAGCDPVMGPGFQVLKPEHEPLLVELPAKCQFFKPELRASKDIEPADIIYLQMAQLLVVLDSLFPESAK